MRSTGRGSHPSPSRRPPSVSKRREIRFVPAFARRRSRPDPIPQQPYRPSTRVTPPRELPPPPPIPSYLPRDQIPLKAFPPRKDSLLTNPKCVLMRNHFFRHHDFEDYPTEHLSLLLDHLREYSSYCASQRDYEEGERADSLAIRIRNDLAMRSDEMWENDDAGLSKFEELREIREADHQSELQFFDIAGEEKRSELLKRLLQDEEEFERHWRVDIPPKYRKPSPQLIVQYKIERTLGLTGQFGEAKRAKEETEALERHETEQAQRLLMRDYGLAREQLMKSQNAELALFEDTRNQERDVILARQKLDMEFFLNRRKVLEQKFLEVKIPKESSVRPGVKVTPNTGNTMVYHREITEHTNCLLPPLKAPNDEEVLASLKRENEEQRRKNRRFKEYQAQKEKEADCSEIDQLSVDQYSITTSSEEEEQPIPELPANVPSESLQSEVVDAKSLSPESLDSDEDEDDLDDDDDDGREWVQRSETFDLTQAEQFRADGGS